MNSSFYNLTTTDTKILKAIAIIFIVLHNFTNSTNSIAQNEMLFSILNTYKFLGVIAYHPYSIVNSLLTYLGHYGVQIFILISGYGLTKKYLNSDYIPYFKYLFSRLIKIVGLMLVGILCLFLTSKGMSFKSISEVSIFFFSLTGNISFDTLYSYVGPWWFFTLIIQLYIIFPALFYIIRKYQMKGAIISLLLSYALIYILLPIATENNIALMGNAPGHLPEFIFGIAIASIKEIKIDIKVFIVACLIFIGSCFTNILFPLSYLSISIVMMYIYINISKYILRSKIVTQSLVFVGNISMFIFILNPLVRKFTLAWLSSDKNSFTLHDQLEIYLVLCIHFVLVIAVSTIVWFIYSQVAKPIKKYTGVSIL